MSSTDSDTTSAVAGLPPDGLLGRIRHWATSDPERPAILSDGEVTTWGAFDERSARLAGGLAAEGIVTGDRVGILMRNAPEFLETFVACAQIGAITVPLNTRLTAAELNGIAADAGISALVTDAGFEAATAALAALLPPDRTFSLDGAGPGVRALSDLLAGPPLRAEAEPAPETQLCIMYSSGTTGLPKGVVLTHGNVLGIAASLVASDGLTPADRAVIPVPLAFTGALISIVTPFLHTGGSLLLEQHLDAERLLDDVEQKGVTFIGAVPLVYQTMANSPTFAQRDLSNLRIAKSGGAPVPESILRTYQARGVPMIGAYGITEGGGFNISLQNEDALRKLGFAGLPVKGQRCRVVREDGSDAAPWEVGELLIAGPTVMAGYWANPDATAEAIRDGWLHTGDLALVDEEGYYKIVDRKKDMIISGGINVYPAEVEIALAGHPDVLEVAVIGVPDERWGERVTACVVARPGSDLDAGALGEFVADLVADYKRPKHYVFLDALPRNMAGKILKRELRERGY
jgi:fatty-acyl-CoA synthase